MKIVMTNTTDHTRKVVSFDNLCNCLNKNRRMINYRLLNNEIIKYSDVDGNYEFKREIG